VADSDIRRELVFNDGGRPYNNKDFESIQNSVNDANQIFNQYLIPSTGKNQWLVTGFVSDANGRVGKSGIVWLNNHMRYVEASTMQFFFW